MNKTGFIIKGISLTVILLGIIQWLGLYGRTYLSHETVCPGFGNISLSSLPKSSIRELPGIKGRKVRIKNRFSEKKEYPLESISMALMISDRDSLQDFLETYREVCGGKPPFYSRIHFVSLDRLKGIEEKKQEFLFKRQQNRENPGWNSLRDKFTQLQKDRAYFINRISHLNGKIEILSPTTYKIMGKVAEKSKNSLFIYGNAVPDKTDSIRGDGFVHNGVIILKNYKESDIVSPEYYEAKHVRAENYQFVKRIDGRDTFGHYFPFYVFERKANIVNSTQIKEIHSMISEYKNKLEKTEKKLKEMEKIEEALLANAF